VLAVTGGVSQQLLTGIVRSMHERDVQHALKLLDELIQHGKDPGRFVFDLIYFLRDLMLYQSAPSLEDILERAMIDDNFKQLADQIAASWIQDAIIQLNQCQQEIKWTNSPKVFIEIAVLTISNRYNEKSEAAAVNDSEAVTTLSNRLEQLERELKTLKETPATNQPAQPEPRRAQPRQSKNGYKVPYEKIRHVLQEAAKPALKQVKSEWAAFLNALKKASAPAHATIQDSKPAAASDQALVVAFKYEIHCSLFLEHRETSESILETAIGKHLTIIPIPDHNWQELRREYIQKQEHASDQPAEDQADPLVEEARKLVGDDLLEIKE
jgi:DNA polymerase-3 subunit gamma/tau